MRVKCIDTGDNTHLTLYKEYEILNESGDTYFIKNDSGNRNNYYKHRFKIVNELIQQDNKLYSTLEMAKILIERPTYKAEYCIEPNCSQVVIVSTSGILICEDDRRPFMITVNDNRQWKIIKPIIKVKFAEAYKYFKNDKNVDMESVVTGNSWHYANELFAEVTDEEIDGDWIVKYRDD